MDGPAPLSYEAVAAWAALLGRSPQPHEVEGLLLLDAITRHPEATGEG